MSSKELEVLLEKWVTNSIRSDEKLRLFELLKDPTNQSSFAEILDRDFLELHSFTEDLQLRDRMFEKIMEEKNRIGKPGRVRSMVRKTKWWWAAAAVLFIVFGLWFIVGSPKGEKPESPEEVADVQAPKGTKATITLADGRTISLDSLTTITQSDVQISKTSDGRVVYSSESGVQSQVQYNTLMNPRGSKVIDLQLSDGSHVWLNAGSSITYPVAFDGERKVSMTGEAYFEVASFFSRKDAKKQPFIVVKSGLQVEVLGTKFNVNAYDDEEDIRVTLLEGSVRVSQLTTGNSQLIKPGQQAAITLNSNDPTHHSPFTIHQADLTAVLAWKNGRFHFQDASIESIMKEVSRWYDVEVVYEGKIKGGFGGDLSRNEPVSKLLYIMEQSGHVRFKIDGRKVIVKP